MPEFRSSPMPSPRRIDVPGVGPEDVLFAKDGTVFTGLRGGRILRIQIDSGEVEVIADVGGIPLGLDWLADGRLLVCNSESGLLAVEMSGTVTTLVDTIEGEPLPFCNNPSVANDGSIYFSSSTRRYGFAQHERDIVENIPTGRLFRLNPDGSVETLLDGLAFANGVAVAPDQSSVLVAETGLGRIQRYWLRGDKRGTSEMFNETLPGLPDNLSVGSDGLVWVALVSPFSRDLRVLHSLPTWTRRVVARLPLPTQAKLLSVMAFTFDGTLTHHLTGDPERFSTVTGVRESGGLVAMGSLSQEAIAVFELDR